MATTSSEPLREVDVPAGVLVRCPLFRFDLRRVTHCEGCEHFHGLTDTIAGPATPFQHRYRVRCAYPIDRELQLLNE